MIKNATIYRIGTLPASLDQVEQAMAAAAFVECGLTQEKSVGWVPPRGEVNGALVEAIGGHWIARLMIETKAVPASALQRELEAGVKAVEAETGRRPGKKEQREMREQARMILLPHTFARRTSVCVWIDRARSMLVLGTTATASADIVTTALVESIKGLQIAPIQTHVNPRVAMALWLETQEPPEDLSVGRECELKSTDNSRAVVRYGQHSLDIAEVRGHIQAGKAPTRLALTWDDRVDFVLTDNMQLRKIAMLDVVFDANDARSDAFDADAAITTAELSGLIAALIKALGGDAP